MEHYDEKGGYSYPFSHLYGNTICYKHQYYENQAPREWWFENSYYRFSFI